MTSEKFKTDLSCVMGKLKSIRGYHSRDPSLGRDSEFIREYLEFGIAHVPKWTKISGFAKNKGIPRVIPPYHIFFSKTKCF